MILGACVRTPSTVSSPSQNSHVSTYPIRSCSCGSSSQLWCFKPSSVNFLALQYPFWKGASGLPAIFTKMAQQEFMRRQNEFFCSVSHPRTLAFVWQFWPSLLAELMRVLENWDLCGTGSHSLSQGWSCCAPICSAWHFLPVDSLCCCILLGYLGDSPTTLLQQQQSWSRATSGYSDSSANIFAVFIGLLSRLLMPTQTPAHVPVGFHWPPLAQVRPSFFLPGFVSHLQTNYLSPQGHLLLVHDTGSEPTVWLCFALPVISNLHSADRQGKISRERKKFSEIKYFLKIGYFFFLYSHILLCHAFNSDTSTWNSTIHSWPDWEPCFCRQGKETHAGIPLLFKDMLSVLAPL